MLEFWYSDDIQGAWIEDGVVDAARGSVGADAGTGRGTSTGADFRCGVSRARTAGAIKQVGNVLLTVSRRICISFL